MSYLLDETTRLDATGDQRYELNTDQRFWNGTSAFGGWVAAVTYAAVESDARFRGELIAQNLQFHAAIRVERLSVSVHLVERRRTIDFWRVDIIDVASESRTLASANLVTGERRESAARFDLPADTIRPRSESVHVAPNSMTPSWFAHYEIFIAKGRPFSANETLRTSHYLRESDGRPVDSKAITAIVDTSMPRTFFTGAPPVPSSTIAMSTHIYGSCDEIAAAGNDFLRLDTESRTLRHSMTNQESALYRGDGILLATSYQTSVFREA